MLRCRDRRGVGGVADDDAGSGRIGDDDVVVADTDPGDENVVYAVESKDGKLRGVITSAFGMYAESASTDMLRKLSMHIES